MCNLCTHKFCIKPNKQKNLKCLEHKNINCHFLLNNNNLEECCCIYICTFNPSTVDAADSTIYIPFQI